MLFHRGMCCLIFILLPVFSESGPALLAHSSRLEFPEEERTNGHSAALNQGLKRWCLNSPTSSSHGAPLRHVMFYADSSLWDEVPVTTVGSGLIVHSLLASLPCLQCSLPNFLNVISFESPPHIHNFFEVSLWGKENKDSSLLFPNEETKVQRK